MWMINLLVNFERGLDISQKCIIKDLKRIYTRPMFMKKMKATDLRNIFKVL